MTVAALNHIAAAARAAERQFPFLVAQRRPSFQACVPREYGVTLDGIASCKKIPNQGRYESAVHPYRLLSRFCRSRPLVSRPFAPRASADDAFALVYALRQAPWPGPLHVGANLLLLLAIIWRTSRSSIDSFT